MSATTTTTLQRGEHANGVAICTCGTVCVAAGPHRPAGVPIYGVTAAGVAICQACAAAADAATLEAGAELGAYLSSDLEHLTTWAGEPLARITSTTDYRGGWHGSRITCWQAVTPTGRRLYGRNGGAGMCTSVRYAKAAKAGAA